MQVCKITGFINAETHARMQAHVLGYSFTSASRVASLHGPSIHQVPTEHQAGLSILLASSGFPGRAHSGLGSCLSFFLLL